MEIRASRSGITEKRQALFVYSLAFPQLIGENCSNLNQQLGEGSWDGKNGKKGQLCVYCTEHRKLDMHRGHLAGPDSQGWFTKSQFIPWVQLLVLVDEENITCCQNSRYLSLQYSKEYVLTVVYGKVFIILCEARVIMWFFSSKFEFIHFSSLLLIYLFFWY